MRASAKKAVTACAAAILLGSVPALAERDHYRGEKTLGVNVGYSGSNKSVFSGIEFSYRFNSWLRVAPEANYIFRRYGRDALELAINTQYPLMLHGGTMALYPQVGINYTSWNYHLNDPDNIESNNRVSRFGMNVAGGYEVNMTSSLRLGFKAGYLFIKDYGCFECSAKIAYIF